MKTETQRKQIAAERAEHNRRIDAMRSQFRPSKDIDSEYQQHQRRLAKILGDDEQGVVGKDFRNV